MSDLISRSKVISVLEQLEEHSLSGKMDISNAIYLLEKQPTAYSVGKVVEELEKNKRKLFYFAKDYEEVGDSKTAEIYADRAGEYIKAIEIVKSGGVSDDCCEWKIFDNSLTGEPQWVYETTCGKYIGEEHTSKAFVYCPYCGKKIKVVD